MLRMEVNFDDGGSRGRLARLLAVAGDRSELHQAMAMGVEEQVRGHLLARNSRSPNTHWYAKAARSVESAWNAEAATVRMPHAGLALRYYGGRVTMKDRLLALPTEHVPVRGGERMRPGEMKDLAFVPNRKGGVSVTRGYLVEGEPHKVTRGPNKGQTRTRPKRGGRLMYVLRGWTDHEADPGVLPGDEQMLATAREAGGDYLDAAMEEGGPA